MYLKAIEIYGFKSFANKVRINLNPGVTAIVGPNGCGKSNIVDAIKWCIGEMSWKSLRMPSMMDVIFAGTTKRQPLNLAEVTLIFDNQERKLNFDFSEVAVTRKIYRSEQSEYFINRTECRLKDIREMFLDTGIGSSGGYAIIDQGEVERVLNASPEERREIFEEVAGVSRYKAKREEALKKLEKVEYDLSLLSGNMEIINEQIKKLDSEAKKARLQQKYKEELKEAEIALIVKEINNNKSLIEQEKAALEPINNEISEISSSITAMEAELSTLNISFTEKNEEEKRIYEEISTTKSNITRIEGNLLKNKELIEALSAQIKQLEETENKNKTWQEKIGPEIKQKKEKLNELKNSYDSLKTEYESVINEMKALQEQIFSIDAQLQEYDKKIQQNYQEELDITREIALIESDIVNTKNEILSLERDKGKIVLDINELQEKSKNISEKINFNKTEFNKLLEKKETKTQEKKSLEIQAKEIEDKILNLNLKNSSEKSRLETLLIQAEKDSYWKGVQSVLGSGIPGIIGTLRHLLKFDKEDKTFIEDAFGKFLDSVVVENENTALKCIEHLKYTQQGRCRFIILDKIPIINSENTNAFSILNKIKFNDEYSNLVKFLAANITFSSSEVKGDFWITGGIEKVFTSQDYWQDIEILKEEIKNNETELNKLLLEKENIQTQISNIQKELQEIEDEISKGNINIISLENEFKTISENLEIKQKNYQIIEKELVSKNKILEDYREKETALKLKLEEIRKNANEFKDLIASLKNQRAELEQKNLSLKEQAGFKNYNISGFQKELERYETEIRNLEQRLTETINETNQIGEKKVELTKKIEELKNSIEKLSTQDIEERNNLKELEIRKTTIADEIEKIKNDIERLNHLLKENKELLDENLQKKQEIDLKINTYSTRIEDLMARLKNDWQTEYESVKDKVENIEVDLERINFLRKRIENMGDVNMTAPQEYEALIAKYNTINSQIEDLNKAKSDLKTAITRINETTIENFKKTFDKVQSYFKQIYSTLFNGGEASLILTNPDNILETGVEIMAHPPGKKLISIFQLSGGEKSLTALALLFSFFCVNPSPFCVMDEVDSALDEANVERFVKLIKEFSSTTQFIIITHNKRTMEIADVMYGITMEELGVSKVISVDLKKAIDMTQSQPVGAKI